MHIHIVSDNTHVQVGKDRHNFDQQTKAAKTWLEKSGGSGKPGYADCLEWLGYPNAKRR